MVASHILGRHILALEPGLRGHDGRGNPDAKLAGGEDGDGATEGADDALAGGKLAQRQGESDEAAKVEDGVEALDTQRREQVGKDHGGLPAGNLEVDDGDEGCAGGEDEELERAGAGFVRNVGVPIVDCGSVEITCQLFLFGKAENETCPSWGERTICCEH